MTTFNNVFSEKIYLKGVELKATNDTDLSGINAELAYLQALINGLTGGPVSTTPTPQIHALDPTVSDDSSENWKVGNLWTTIDSIFICSDNAENNAVWKKVPDNEAMKAVHLGFMDSIVELENKAEDAIIKTTQNEAAHLVFTDSIVELENKAEDAIIQLTQNAAKFTDLDRLTEQNVGNFTRLTGENIQQDVKLTALDTINTENIGKFNQIDDSLTGLEFISTTTAAKAEINKTAIAQTQSKIWADLDIYDEQMIIVKTDTGDNYTQDDGVNPILSQSSDHFRGGCFSNKLFNQKYIDEFATHTTGIWNGTTGVYTGSTSTKVFASTSDTVGQTLVAPFFQIQFRNPENIDRFYYKGEAIFLLCYSNDGSNWYDSDPLSSNFNTSGKIYTINPTTATHWRLIERYDGVPDSNGWCLNYALYFYRKKVETDNTSLISQVNTNTVNISNLSNMPNLSGSINSNTNRINLIEAVNETQNSNIAVNTTKTTTLENNRIVDVARVDSIEVVNNTQFNYISSNITKINSLEAQIAINSTDITNLAADLKSTGIKLEEALVDLRILLGILADPFPDVPHTLTLAQANTNFQGKDYRPLYEGTGSTYGSGCTIL